MKNMEECTEKMDLLEKTDAVEEKKKKRLLELALTKQKDQESAKQLNLYDGGSVNNSLLNQEESQRKLVVEYMIRNSTPSNQPIVKCLTNVQGNYIYTTFS